MYLPRSTSSALHVCDLRTSLLEWGPAHAACHIISARVSCHAAHGRGRYTRVNVAAASRRLDFGFYSVQDALLRSTAEELQKTTQQRSHMHMATCAASTAHATRGDTFVCDPII